MSKRRTTKTAKTPKPDPMHKRCGAKTRRATPCTNWVMPNGRCRMHGGKSTGPKNAARPGNKNGEIHGGYARVFTAEMQERLEGFDVHLGQVDKELAIARLQLASVVVAQEEALAAPNDMGVGMELAEVEASNTTDLEKAPYIKDDGEVGTRSKEVTHRRNRVLKKRPDYRAVIDRCLARVGHLEIVRQNLKLELVEGLQAKLEALLRPGGRVDG